MTVDTPAKIAILGAGPMGVEVGLYARYLGYEVVLLDCGGVAANLRKWGHLRMFSPFGRLRSSLGLAALRAQDPEYQPPESDARLTGNQWADKYVYPLSQTDLLADHIRTETRVVRVGRRHLLNDEYAGQPQRADDGFRLLLEHADCRESYEMAEVVIDTTGVLNQPNWCGSGGLPARGERRLRSQIEPIVPDIPGAERAKYLGQHTLVVGSGLSAAASVVSLGKLIQRDADTRITWLTRHSENNHCTDPIQVSKFVHSPERQRLAQAANDCVEQLAPRIEHCSDTDIEAIEFDDKESEFLVWFEAESAPQRFDRIISNVGYRPDISLWEELQLGDGGLHTNANGPVDNDRAVSNDNASPPRELCQVVTSEPNFYILGAKSFGRRSSFSMSIGLEQIRFVFGIIGGRADLDLYATAEKLAY